MIACIHTPTGHMIEAQSDATPGTLVNNNSAYYPLGEIEEREITREEFNVLFSESSKRQTVDEILSSTGVRAEKENKRDSILTMIEDIDLVSDEKTKEILSRIVNLLLPED